LIGTLPATGESLRLGAAGLVFSPTAPEVGRVSVTIDGVERAVILEGNFRVPPGQTSLPFVRVTESYLNLAAPAYARPKQDVRVKVAAANIPDGTDVTLSVIPGPEGSKDVTQSFKLTGPRDLRAGAEVGKEGSFDVTTSVKPWEVPIDTRGLYGPVTVLGAYTVGGVTRTVTTVIVFDDTPPTGVAIVPFDPKAYAVRGRPYEVRAIGTDPESKVTSVEFFDAVEPPALLPDGKYPPEPKPIVARLVAKDAAAETVYAGALTLPEKAGPRTVYVRFTNGVGLTSVAKAVIAVIDPLPGEIRGKVVYGGLTQKKDVDVWLTSKDGKTSISQTKVNAEGLFVFTKVPAGEYRLVAQQKVTTPKPLIGEAAVLVKEGPEPTPATVELQKQR
jgi:hypothetical protein